MKRTAPVLLALFALAACNQHMQDPATAQAPVVTQQAPVPGAMQASRPSPVHTALMKAQSMIGGTIQSRNRNVTMVRIVSRGVAKRFSLSQPTTPPVATGGAIRGLSCVRT